MELPRVVGVRPGCELLVGILVGGKGRRMGGLAKGNLQREGQTLLQRLLECITEAARQTDCKLMTALVGVASAYDVQTDLRLLDAPAGIGPMGGVRSLLLGARGLDCEHAIALAVDLPYLEASLLKRLCEFPTGSAVVAPRMPAAGLQASRMQRVWQPLCARYRVSVALDALDESLRLGQHSLQRMILELGAAAGELPLFGEEARQLADWDSPADMQAPDPD